MAYMFTPLDIAVNIVLENEDVNTLETCNLVTGVPTEASTQTIMCMIDFENCYLQDNQLVEWPRAKGYEVALPGHLATTLCHPWGGTGFPVWYQDHPTVRNVKSLTAFNDRSLLEGLLALQTNYEENLRDLPQEQRTAELTKVADSMTPGMPPREEFLVHRSLDVVIGTGTSGVHTCVIRSGPAYLQTGLYMAAAANKLLTVGPDNVGTVSPCQAFGYKYLLGALKSFFPTEVDIY
jgi:hypothetical protein